MDLITALKTGKLLRRPIDKHKGLSKDGWLARDYVIKFLTSTTSASIFEPHYNIINEYDLLAEDWQINGEYNAKQ